MIVERKWTFYLLRGLITLAIGIVLFAWPKPSAELVIYFLAALAILNGLIQGLVAIFTREPAWGWRLLGAVLFVVLGIVMIAWPGTSALVALYLIAIYAILAGVTEIIVALRWGAGAMTKAVLVLLGLIGVVIGIVLIVNPKEGALAILWLIALFAVLNGAFTIVLSFFVRSEQKEDIDAGPMTPAAA